jgi:hypothetical protein
MEVLTGKKDVISREFSAFFHLSREYSTFAATPSIFVQKFGPTRLRRTCAKNSVDGAYVKR